MKKKHLLLLVFSFFYTFHLLAQAPKGYQAGYYLTTDADTVFCMINIPKSSKQSHTVNIYKNDQLIQLQSEKILGYSITQDQIVFESKQVNHQNKKDKERLLMQLIYRGVLTLYRTYDVEKQEQFYIENEKGEIILLKEVRNTEEGQTRLAQPYLGVLEYLTQDCPQSVKRVKLRTSSLIKFIKKYASCKSAESTYQLQPKLYKGRVQLRALLGVGYNSMATSGDPLILRISDPEGTTGYEGGLSLELLSPSLRRPFASVIIDAYYTRKGVTSTERIYSTKSNLHYLDLSVSARLYFVPKRDKTNFFIQAGILAGYLLNGDNAFTRKFYDGNPNTYDLFPSTTRQEIGWLASAGLTFDLGGKPWEISLKYAHTYLPFNFVRHGYANQAYRLNVGIPLN